MSLMTPASLDTILSLLSHWVPTFSPIKLQVLTFLRVSTIVSAALSNKWSQQKKIFILLTDLCLSFVISSQSSITCTLWRVYSSRSSLIFFSVELCLTLYFGSVSFIILISLSSLNEQTSFTSFVFRGKCPKLFLWFLTQNCLHYCHFLDWNYI